MALEGVGELGERGIPFDRSSHGDLDLTVPTEDAAHLLECPASIGQQLQPAPAHHASEGAIVVRQLDPMTQPSLALAGRSPDGMPRVYLSRAHFEGDLEEVIGRRPAVGLLIEPRVFDKRPRLHVTGSSSGDVSDIDGARDARWFATKA